MNQDDHIVAFITIVYDADKVIAKEIGIARHADSKAVALRSLVLDFQRLIEVRRSNGTLFEFLRDLDITWGFRKDFPDVKSPFVG